MKQRNDSLRKKEIDLETFSKVLTGKEQLMSEYERSLLDRNKSLSAKEQAYGVRIGQSGKFLCSGTKGGTSQQGIPYFEAFFFHD